MWMGKQDTATSVGLVREMIREGACKIVPAAIRQERLRKRLLQGFCFNFFWVGHRPIVHVQEVM